MNEVLDTLVLELQTAYATVARVERLIYLQQIQHESESVCRNLEKTLWAWNYPVFTLVTLNKTAWWHTVSYRSENLHIVTDGGIPFAVIAGKTGNVTCSVDPEFCAMTNCSESSAQMDLGLFLWKHGAMIVGDDRDTEIHQVQSLLEAEKLRAKENAAFMDRLCDNLRKSTTATDAQ